MKKAAHIIALVAFSCFTTNIFAQSIFTYPNHQPRAYLWALAGSDPLARGDVLFPINSQSDSLSYLDLQGEYGNADEWYAGLGSGYRRIVNNNQIYGGYLFLDSNGSTEHHTYWVLSPGLETFTCTWDLRINGYIPVSDKRTQGNPFFKSDIGCTDTNCGANDITFQGHQQFQNRFVNIEEVGPGADAEVGHRFSNGIALYGGAYAFHLQDTNNIQGVESRFELPIQRNITFTTEVSYDNYEHGRVAAGFRVQFDKPVNSHSCIRDRMRDPIVRNLGSVARGTGIPIVKFTKDQGRFLRRDNIYFFTTNGGVPFTGVNSGTIENPLAENQFNQSTVTSIAGFAPDANFYLSPGTYTITPNAPNGRISFANGQSVYGRSVDYTCSAMGSERPLILGGFDLLAGNNTLSSIQLFDQTTDGTGSGSHVTALTIENAPNIHLCNDDINATATETASLTGENLATAINANNSNVTINNSTIEANALAEAGATTTGLPVNSAVGLGGIVASTTTGNTFNGNTFAITQSAITALAQTNSGESNALNLSIGIGTIAAPSSSSGISNAFENNVFALTNTAVTATTLSEGIASGSDNLAIGIGASSAHIPGGTNAFNNNNFMLLNSAVTANATVQTINNNSVNAAIGVGAESGFNGNNQFNSNQMSFTNSSINATALVGTNSGTSGQTSMNSAVGIGIGAFISTSTFENNTIQLQNSNISALATTTSNTTSDNFAIGIGAFAFGSGSAATFDSNVFTLDNCAITADATVGSDNLAGSLNEAIGIGIDNNLPNATFTNNSFSITRSLMNIEALIQGNNQATNKALGLFAGNGTVIDILNSGVNVAAIVNGTNTGTNTALGTQTSGTGIINATGTTFLVTQIP